MLATRVFVQENDFFSSGSFYHGAKVSAHRHWTWIGTGDGWLVGAYPTFSLSLSLSLSLSFFFPSLGTYVYLAMTISLSLFFTPYEHETTSYFSLCLYRFGVLTPTRTLSPLPLSFVEVGARYNNQVTSSNCSAQSKFAKNPLRSERRGKILLTQNEPKFLWKNFV